MKRNSIIRLGPKKLPTGLDLNITLEALPPRDPPTNGAEWSPEIDYPGIRIVIHDPSPGTDLCNDSLGEIGLYLVQSGWVKCPRSHPADAKWCISYVTYAVSAASAYRTATYAVSVAMEILTKDLEPRAKRLVKRQRNYSLAIDEKVPDLGWPISAG